MSSKLILYDHPLSGYSQKIRLALREKGLLFEIRYPHAADSTSKDDFLNGNLRSEVPFLVDGDLKIFDSTIILEYIEDKWPDQTPLRPQHPAARARTRMIEDMCDTHYEAINWGLGEVFWFGRAEGDLATRLRSTAADQTAQIQQWLSERLGDAQYFGGDQFGLADIAVFPFLNRSVYWKLGPEVESPLAVWLGRVKRRPAVQETVAEYEAAILAIPAVADVYTSGKRQREYRDHRLEWMVKSGGVDVVLEGLRRKNIRFSWPNGQ
ncbi:hypothetical protein RBB50_008861 [Rhinocladiella similis]